MSGIIVWSKRQSSHAHGRPRVAGFEGKPLFPATGSNLWGNPTGPKLQGLSDISPPFFIPNFQEEQALANSGSKTKNCWPLKIFLITFFVSAALAVVAEVFIGGLGLVSAVIIVLFLIFLGILFDIIGVAFASCDQTPFIAMSSRGIKSARRSLRLLKEADVVSNICNDVVGDICGIVSGSAGAAIAVRAAVMADSPMQLAISAVIGGLISAFTVGGKALGKRYAISNNVKIVEIVGNVFCFFGRKK